MNQSQMNHDGAVAATIPEAAPPRIRVVVNRLPGRPDWRPGVAPTLDVIIEAESEDPGR